jgi:hypothetical protein
MPCLKDYPDTWLATTSVLNIVSVTLHNSKSWQVVFFHCVYGTGEGGEILLLVFFCYIMLFPGLPTLRGI